MQNQIKNHYKECKNSKGSVGYALINQAKQEERIKIIKEIRKYKMEFANTKLEDRKNGWDILVEVENRIKIN